MTPVKRSGAANAPSERQPIARKKGAAKQTAKQASPSKNGPLQKEAPSSSLPSSVSFHSEPQSMVIEPLEQVTVTCISCGRRFTLVKLQGLSSEGMMCPRCAAGEVQVASE